MFNVMLYHGFIPENSLFSSNISIQDVSLSNSICKLYEYTFIDLNIEYLKTDDMQCGFISNQSTFFHCCLYGYY